MNYKKNKDNNTTEINNKNSNEELIKEEKKEGIENPETMTKDEILKRIEELLNKDE